MPTEIKAIIFDYDGVVVDTLKQTMDAFNILSKKYKYKPLANKDDFVRTFDKNMVDVLLNLGLSTLRIPIFLNDCKKELKASNKKVKVIPGIGQLCEVLSEHFQLALVTSNFKELVSEVLTRDKIQGKFKVIITDEPTVKKSQKIRQCIEQLGLKSNEIVFIADTFGDIMEAKEAHVKTIAVTWGYQLKSKLLPASPDFIVDKPSELLEALNVMMQE